MPFDIDDHSLSTIFAISLVPILGASEVGHRLGVRAARRGAAMGVSPAEP